jgi:peptide/nickel transport system ATP-binding protein
MNKPATPLLEVEDIVHDYPLPRPHPFAAARRLRVLHGVSLRLERAAGLGIVGESGCGKSTLARTVMALEHPRSGAVRINGENVLALPRRELRRARRHFQAIFQDPYGSLDPRHRIGRIVAEPIAALEPDVDAATRRLRVAEVLDAVGLPATATDKYPHEFSGGQRQRIAIARALVTRPALIVADEPVSALDVSVQAQVLNLMMDLQERFGLAYLFISHDLSVVRWITDAVAVMYLGRIVEEGPTADLFAAPRHPYTRALIEAIPTPHRPGDRTTAATAAAEMAAATPSSGCPYVAKCPLAIERCRVEAPALLTHADGRRVACHLSS